MCYRRSGFQTFQKNNILLIFSIQVFFYWKNLETCKGESYFWCKTDNDGWDYCSPSPGSNASIVKTRSGHSCSGPCDYYATTYKYCIIKEGAEFGYYWDYCGSSSSTASILLIFCSLYLQTTMLKNE